MKKSALTIILIGFLGNLSAQQVKLPVGKKFQMITAIKGNSITSMMGQDIEMTNTSTVYVDHELKSADEKKFVLGLKITRITGSVAGMGQEQQFDSDDPSFKSNPGFEEGFKSLGKETEVVVEEGKVAVKGELAEAARIISGNAGDANEMGKIFLLLKENDLKTGYSWNTNTSGEGSSAQNVFTVGKVTDTEVEILVDAKVKNTSTINQNGMEIKQQTEATTKAARIYNKSTFLLISETANSEIKGNMEIMGQQVPLNSKQEITTVVKLL